MTGGPVAVCPAAQRPVDIRFFVDNKKHLSMNYLEITVPEDRYRKRIVKVEPSAETEMAEGFLTTFVPHGDITVITCALVNCPGKEVDLLCGTVSFPEQIAVDRIHEVTYSTEHACQDDAASPALAQRPHIPDAQ